MKDIKEIVLEDKKYRVKENLKAVYQYERDLNKKDNENIGNTEKEMLLVYYILKYGNREKTDEYDKFTMSWDKFNDVIIDNMDKLQSLTEDNNTSTDDNDKKK